jgi:hypothetical protein
VGRVLRLRISLADRAGALAQAAGVIGLHGGNIVSIDVHRAGSEAAIDDVVVEFNGEPEIRDLRHDLATQASTALLSHEEADAVDPVIAGFAMINRLLDVVHAAAPGTDSRGTAALAGAVGAVCCSPAVWIDDAEQARRYEAGATALSRGRPASAPVDSLPAHVAGRIGGDVHVLAVPLAVPGAGGAAGGAVPGAGTAGDGGSDRRRVVFLARPAGVDFTETEIGRIQVLAKLHDRLVGLAGDRS